jgi:hypothetical protein
LPDFPASCITIGWKSGGIHPWQNFSVYEKESADAVAQTVADTEECVENKLSKLGLCPFTKSMQRAAIGLEHVGVYEGPIVIRHAGQLDVADAAQATRQ